MTDFKPGELVDITIEHAIVAEAKPDVLAVNLPGTKPGEITGFITINPTRAGVTVARVAPADWPPRHGDMWRDNDNLLWFVSLRESGHEFPRLETVFTPADARQVDRFASYEAGRLLAQRGPMTLVHREHPDSAESGE
ncbi:hypothetical protein [Micromonospora costi]|uniref:Uncharacterized protein n=1 Tax=Micromonospora costi TaxID=1530042 RepID=A0A3B0AA19_9ACTN|nr:hypothetical protein [Micromonospora costi]RKN55907.1 hypothetical protein D7193_15055 [Micromonospora costi]